MTDEYMSVTVPGDNEAKAVATQLYSTPGVHSIVVLKLKDSYFISWYLRTM